MNKVYVEEVAQGKGGNGLYFKRPAEGKFWLRFYPLQWINAKGEKEDRIGKIIRNHFDQATKKRTPCIEGCPLCKKGEVPTVRHQVGVADAKNSVDKLQLYDMPVSLWKLLRAFYETNKDDIEIFGDEGVTFEINYNPSAEPASKYSLAPWLKDKRKLNNKSKILYWDPTQAPKKNEEPQLSNSDDKDMFEDLAQVEKDITPSDPNL